MTKKLLHANAYLTTLEIDGIDHIPLVMEKDDTFSAFKSTPSPLFYHHYFLKGQLNEHFFHLTEKFILGHYISNLNYLNEYREHLFIHEKDLLHHYSYHQKELNQPIELLSDEARCPLPETVQRISYQVGDDFEIDSLAIKKVIQHPVAVDIVPASEMVSILNKNSMQTLNKIRKTD